jgi:hypothetical protein
MQPLGDRARSGYPTLRKNPREASFTHAPTLIFLRRLHIINSVSDRRGLKPDTIRKAIKLLACKETLKTQAKLLATINPSTLLRSPLSLQKANHTLKGMTLLKFKLRFINQSLER